MADTKITALTAIGANPIIPSTFPIPMVDLTDTSMAASGTTKKVTVNQILGAGGTATLASATITGDLTVDTSTLKVDSTNNRVGVVTASPNDSLEVVGSGANGIRVSRAGLPTQYTTLSAGATGPSLDVSSAIGSLSFGIGGSTAMTLNSTGLGIGTTVLGGQKLAIGSTSETSATASGFNVISSRATITATCNGAVDAAGTTINYSWANGGQGPLIFRNAAISNVMTLDASGNVGIGVTPSAWTIKALQVGSGFAAWSTSVTNSRTFANTYYDGAYKYVGTGRATQYEQDGYHAWYNSASGTAGNAITFTQAMTLDASGNLLVGTTAMPSGVTYARLVAKSTSADWSGVIWNSNATPYGFRIQHDTDSNGTGNEFLYCLGSTNLRASIRSNGGLANYQANDVNLSDIRTKTDIKPLASYWNKIKSLELVTFKYKDQTHNDDNIGLIAQQVESVAPELVDVDGFGETPSDGVPLKTIYTTDLYHASIKALQEAMTRIEALEAKLA
jgi:hypothetical protein